jgi:hypothetical protein
MADINSTELTWFMAITCYMRGLTYFRAFEYMRFFVRMVIEVSKDVSSFIVILAYSTFSFAVLYGIAKNVDVEEAWRESYELNMGAFDNTGYDALQWFTFLLATLVNCIVMLNLLISILGDAYKNIQEKAVESDVIEMLYNIIELESLMIWKRMEGTSLYLQKCDIVDDSGKDLMLEEKIGDIQRKTNRIYKKVIRTDTETPKPEEVKIERQKKSNPTILMSSQRFYTNKPLIAKDYKRQVTSSPDPHSAQSESFNDFMKREIESQVRLFEERNQKAISDMEARLQNKMEELISSFEIRLMRSMNRI